MHLICKDWFLLPYLWLAWVRPDRVLICLTSSSSWALLSSIIFFALICRHVKTSFHLLLLKHQICFYLKHLNGNLSQNYDIYSDFLNKADLNKAKHNFNVLWGGRSSLWISVIYILLLYRVTGVHRGYWIIF